MNIDLILWLLSAICFGMGAFRAWFQDDSKFDLLCLGLMFAALTMVF